MVVRILFRRQIAAVADAVARILFRRQTAVVADAAARILFRRQETTVADAVVTRLTRGIGAVVTKTAESFSSVRSTLTVDIAVVTA